MDIVLSALKSFAHWEIYVACIEYLAISLCPYLVIFFRPDTTDNPFSGCLWVIALTFMQTAATLILIITLAPILLGVGSDAAWLEPFTMLASHPGRFSVLTLTIIAVSAVLALIPILGRIESLRMIIIGVMILSPLIQAAGGPYINPFPGFLITFGIVALSGVLSLLSYLALSYVGVRWIGQEISLFFAPYLSTVLGLIPLAIYAAWLASLYKIT